MLSMEAAHLNQENSHHLGAARLSLALPTEAVSSLRVAMLSCLIIAPTVRSYCAGQQLLLYPDELHKAANIGHRL